MRGQREVEVEVGSDSSRMVLFNFIAISNVANNVNEYNHCMSALRTALR